MKNAHFKNVKLSQVEQENPLRKLSVVTFLLFLPAAVLWGLGMTLGWFPRPLSIETWQDRVVSTLFGIVFLYYGFVVHVMPSRVSGDTWLKHLLIAVPLMGATLLLFTLHFSGAIQRLAHFVSSVAHLEAIAGNVISNILGWVASGVTGNFAYDLIKRSIKKQDTQKEPARRRNKK